MTRLQKMVLKPKEQLVSRLFLSPKLRQNLTVLSYSTHDLIKAMKELSASDPFVFYVNRKVTRCKIWNGYVHLREKI